MTVKIAVMLLTVCASLNAGATVRPLAEPRPSNRLTGMGEYEVPPPPRILPNFPLPDGLGASGAAPAEECALDVPSRDQVLEADQEVNRFPLEGYAPPERIAEVFHKVWLVEKTLGAACKHALKVWLEDSRRTLHKALERSLEKDRFVLEGNLASLERKLEDLEGRAAAAEASGWPEGSRGMLATEYVGYYQGQRSELLRMYIDLAKGAFRAEEVNDSRPWFEEATSEAGKALVRVTWQARRLETKLWVARDGREATPRRFEPGAGPIFGDKAFDGALPTFDGGSTFVTGGAFKDIRTPPSDFEIPPPHAPNRGERRMP